MPTQLLEKLFTIHPIESVANYTYYSGSLSEKGANAIQAKVPKVERTKPQKAYSFLMTLLQAPLGLTFAVLSIPSAIYLYNRRKNEVQQVISHEPNFS